ncbi:MAG: universal stress protein [Pseudomonadota bacterium]
MTKDRQEAPFKNILVVSSGDAVDAELFQRAAELALDPVTVVTVLHVVEPPPGLESVARVAGRASSLAMAETRSEALKTLESRLDRSPLSGRGQVVVRIGKPFVEIIQCAHERTADLVIKTAESHEGVHRYLFTSTDQHLLRKCPAPVWLKTPAAQSSLKRILVTVDIDEDDAKQPETQRGLNARLIQSAAQLAHHCGARLTIVHVWDAPEEKFLRRWLPDGSDADVYVHKVWESRIAALDLLTTSAALEDVEGPEKRLERGDPKVVIPELVRSLQVDLLVMGTIARMGVPGFIIGNTAEDILNSVECSVMTVKPPGYISPVTPTD